MITVDERIELLLPTQEWVIFMIRVSYAYLYYFYADIYQDAVVRVLTSRPQLEKVLKKKRSEVERNRVARAYIKQIIKRAVNDIAVLYKNAFSIPARHEYMDITPAFVHGEKPPIRMTEDDERVTLTDSSPTEDDILFEVDLDRIRERLSMDAKILLGLLRDRYHRREILDIMGITSWRYRILLDELRCKWEAVLH